MCYLLYWAIQFPLMFVSPQNIRYLFTVKGIIVPFAWLSILVWSFIKVPAKTSLESLHTNLSGSSLSWAWLSALNIALGSYATLSVNIPDFTVSTKISLPSIALRSKIFISALCEKRESVSQLYWVIFRC